MLVLAGQVTLDAGALRAAGITAAHSIADYAGSVQLAIDDAANQLTGLAQRTAPRWPDELRVQGIAGNKVPLSVSDGMSMHREKQ